MAEHITMVDGTLTVPDAPIIPFIEGDGTGVDIWPAAKLVLDAAIEKSYGGRRKVAWTEVLAVEKAFEATGTTVKDVDWFIPHQANKRIIDGSAHKLGIPPGKIVTTVDRHGNTSAASIPLALADAVADRRIKRDDLLLFEAMGGGFTWGAALVRW